LCHGVGNIVRFWEISLRNTEARSVIRWFDTQEKQFRAYKC
jgi:hypothetical protein